MAMNGAQALIRTLVASGVDVCFTNPGTSEMHFVAALDTVPQMRAVLGLFEGVVTGAADGYARMAGRPAAALLHLGPGLGNGLANLHNARRGHVPVVVIVGDHATHHRGLEAPLESDIQTVARNVSQWIRSSARTAEIGGDAAQAVQASFGPPGQPVTLILPADVSWGTDGAKPAEPLERPQQRVDQTTVEGIAEVLRSSPSPMLFLGGPLLADPAALATAHRVARATGARVLAQTFPTRLARGGDVAGMQRLPYGTPQAVEALAGVTDLVLVGAPEPVAFFAHPGAPSRLVPEGCTLHTMVKPGCEGTGTLTDLADALGPRMDDGSRDERPPSTSGSGLPTGRLDARSAAAVIGALLPEGAIVSDEAITSGMALPSATARAPRHDWLCITGGAIGQGLPVATGAAVASPDRRVLSLQADGSAMYTLQALWTQAREGLDVTTVIYNNGSYEILAAEMQRVGVEGAGPRATALYDLTGPRLDFVSLSQGMGVPATRATTAEEFASKLRAALAEPGPSLVEAVIPRLQDS